MTSNNSATPLTDSEKAKLMEHHARQIILYIENKFLPAHSLEFKKHIIGHCRRIAELVECPL